MAAIRQKTTAFLLTEPHISHTEGMTLPNRAAVSRREYLKAAVAVGGTAGLAACMEELDADEPIPTGGDSLPDRQHAWNDTLAVDDGNDIPPKHHVLRYVNLTEGVGPADAREPFADALASFTDAIAWGPEGLLFTVGYSPAYFDRFDESLPESVDLPAPRELPGPESDVTLDEVDLVVHLASDRPDILLVAEEGLFGERAEVNGVELPDLDGLFAFPEYDRRTGFVGAGLPADNQDIRGISGEPVPEEAPFFMGFRSGFAESQPTEDRVTLTEGPFAGGTTQHAETLDIQLNAWFSQENHHQRVAKMFSPEHAREEMIEGVGENLGSATGVVPEAMEDLVDKARDEGVVGHAQKAAAAREDGEPIILRRDFNTTDEEQAGLHFVSLQQAIEDFVTTRNAMTGEAIAEGSGVGPRVNNGILQYVFVRNRGNFLVPPRELQSMPTPTGTIE